MLPFATDQSILAKGSVSALAGAFLSLNRHRYSAAQVAHLSNKIHALSASAGASDSATFANLRDSLFDASATVRSVAASALVDVHGPAALPALLAALRQAQDRGDEAQTLVDSVVKLIQSQPDGSLLVLTGLTGSGSSNMRIDAAWALSYLPSAAAEPALLALLDDASPDVRAVAANSLRRAPSAAALECLARRFAVEASVEARIAIVIAVRRTASPASAATLRLAEQDADPRVRALCPARRPSIRQWFGSWAAKSGSLSQA